MKKIRHSWNRVKYEYRNRRPLNFLYWFYHSLKMFISYRIQRRIYKTIGKERYVYYLKKWRCRKIDEKKFIEVIEIDPKDIKYISSTSEGHKWLSTGKISSGNWDKNLERYEDLPFHKAMKKHFKQNKDWENIEEVQKALEGGIKWPDYVEKKGRETLLENLEETDKLFEKIRNNGYKRQSELSTRTKTRKKIGLDEFDEVCVDIDRNGNPLFVDGRHRLSIAKILELNRIPVRIVKRHREYYRK